MLSVVIPAHNEKDSVEALHGELSASLALVGMEAEIIFIDDGSTDATWQVIAELARRDPRVRGLRFRRNFGKAAALSAGFRSATGDLILTLDADLQDDPKEIPAFLAAIKGGLDVVSGWKQVRHDPWHKVWPSRVFNGMVSWLTKVKLHDHNCGMKCYRKEVLREVRLYGELHRFIPVLAAARGFKVGEVVIRHRPRQFGQSKYGMRRFVKGFLDLLTVKFLTDFSHRPQHVLGTLGLGAFFVGGLILTYLAGVWVWRMTHRDAGLEPLHQRALLFYGLGLLLLGAQFLSMGFLAELLTAFNHRPEDAYSVAERTDFSPPQSPLAPLGRGDGGEGGRPEPVEALSPHPRPLAPEAGARGENGS
jgi:glycosyltransferase involved in cell wall biosynthesis